MTRCLHRCIAQRYEEAMKLTASKAASEEASRKIKEDGERKAAVKASAESAAAAAAKEDGWALERQQLEERRKRIEVVAAELKATLAEEREERAREAEKMRDSADTMAARLAKAESHNAAELKQQVLKPLFAACLHGYTH